MNEVRKASTSEARMVASARRWVVFDDMRTGSNYGPGGLQAASAARPSLAGSKAAIDPAPDEELHARPDRHKLNRTLSCNCGELTCIPLGRSMTLGMLT